MPLVSYLPPAAVSALALVGVALAVRGDAVLGMGLLGLGLGLFAWFFWRRF